MSTVTETCPGCGSAELETSPAQPPHHERLDCKACGRFLRWVAAPMTPERAAGFVLPYGKYRGETLASVGSTAHGREYLAWLAGIAKPNVRRAIECYLETTGDEPQGQDADD